MSASEQLGDFESVKARLAEIADAVEDEGISLDDALDLYEEAVTLGLRASDLLETGVEAPDAEAEEPSNSEGDLDGEPAASPIEGDRDGATSSESQPVEALSDGVVPGESGER